MASSKLRQALGAAKDRTSIALARAGGADEVAADIDVAIVRATAHGESSAGADRHAQEILTLTRYSRARVAACVASVSRRLERTRAWHVAAKALALLHRLLDEGDPAFEPEFFLATTRRGGRRVLDDVASRFGRARFRDWDLAAFVRAYAGYLDDRLKLRTQGRGVASPGKWRVDDDAGDTDWAHGAREACWELVPAAAAEKPATEDLVARAQQLKHLLGRFIECWPTGKARASPVVAAALYRLVKDSAGVYRELTEVMAVLVDGFAEMDTRCCVRVHAVFTSLAKLFDELHDFYSWCQATAVCRACEIPDVERVKQKKLDLMDEFIRDRLSSASSRRSLSVPAPLSLPSSAPVKKHDVVVKAIEPAPAPKDDQADAREKNDAPAEPAGVLVVVDDKMTDFLNLNEDTSPQCAEEHGRRDLALALVAGDPTPATPKWVTFDDPSPDCWETTALLQPTSRLLATQRSELGGGFNAALLSGMYSHAAANEAVGNARAFAGSASSVATQPLGATTVLALPPPRGANANTTAAARADPFAASLAVPPPTCVQMKDLQSRQRLLVEERTAWQEYGRQRATWNQNYLL